MLEVNIDFSTNSRRLNYFKTLRAFYVIITEKKFKNINNSANSLLYKSLYKNVILNFL